MLRKLFLTAALLVGMGSQAQAATFIFTQTIVPAHRAYYQPVTYVRYVPPPRRLQCHDWRWEHFHAPRGHFSHDHRR